MFDHDLSCRPGLGHGAAAETVLPTVSAHGSRRKVPSPRPFGPPAVAALALSLLLALTSLRVSVDASVAGTVGPALHASDGSGGTAAGFAHPGQDNRPLGASGSMALGDLVWYDHDRDGLQGAGESPARGVRIELWCGSPATLLATAVSSSEGHYGFTDSLLVDPDPADDVGQVEGGIPRSTACELRMPLQQDAQHITLTLADAPQPANGGFPATNNHPLTDVADSDAQMEGSVALISITTAAAGGANLGLDFGLTGIATSTHTPIHTETPTSSATPTPEPTSSPTAGDSPTPEATSSPTPGDTPTPTKTPTPTPESYCLGDRLFIDLDNDGRFEPQLGEMGVEGVPLEIYLDDGDGLLDLPDDLRAQQGSTDPGGHYGACFTSAGPYIVAIPATAFAAGEALAGAMTSTGNEVSGMAPDPDDDVDHDDNGTLMPDGSVASKAITLAAGTEPDAGADGDGPNGNQTLDFGFHFPAGSTATPTTDSTAIPTASQTPDPLASPTATAEPLCLGDQVFLDLNRDGRFQPAGGEFGIDKTLLLLFRDDGDGLLDRDDGPPIDAMITADGGRYAFCSLQPGDYIVEILASNFDPGEVLDGLQSSTGNDISGKAPDPDDDVNDDDNGTPRVTGDVVSQAVTLAAGTEPDVAADGDGTNNNHTLDFGLIKPAPPTGLLFGGLEVSAEGDGLTAAIRWRTLLEEGLLGFRVERANSVAGPWTALSGGRLIVAEDVRAGARYATTDRPGSSGRFHYRVVAVAADGTESRFGPAGIALGRWLPVLRFGRLYLPRLGRP